MHGCATCLQDLESQSYQCFTSSTCHSLFCVQGLDLTKVHLLLCVIAFYLGLLTNGCSSVLVRYVSAYQFQARSVSRLACSRALGYGCVVNYLIRYVSLYFFFDIQDAYIMIMMMFLCTWLLVLMINLPSHNPHDLELVTSHALTSIANCKKWMDESSRVVLD